MLYPEVQAIALAILTSIITGGFILVFVEIGNRKNRENDRHDQILSPFMHKLSSYLRFMNWCQGAIGYQKPLDEHEEPFKMLVERLGKQGGRLIMSGGDFTPDSFSAKALNAMALDINNVWYWHDKMNPCRLTWTGTFGQNFIVKELAEINPAYLNEKEDVNLVAKVSGEFYTDIYQPIEYETYKHESMQRLFRSQTIIVGVFVVFVLAVLMAMILSHMPVWLLQTATIIVIMMLTASLLMLAIDSSKQIQWLYKCAERKTKKEE